MNERDPAYLWDMHAAALEVVRILDGVSLRAFTTSILLCRATERCLEIIGEAARRVSPECIEANPHIPWRDIIGQRNILAHEYGQVDHELVYRTAIRDIPVLLGQLEALLSAVETATTDKK